MQNYRWSKNEEMHCKRMHHNPDKQTTCPRLLIRIMTMQSYFDQWKFCWCVCSMRMGEITQCVCSKESNYEHNTPTIYLNDFYYYLYYFCLFWVIWSRGLHWHVLIVHAYLSLQVKINGWCVMLIVTFLWTYTLSYLPHSHWTYTPTELSDLIFINYNVKLLQYELFWMNLTRLSCQKRINFGKLYFRGLSSHLIMTSNRWTGFSLF
jgi:hypothetical protein